MNHDRGAGIQPGMPDSNPQAAFLNLLASTYARYGVEIQALPPTGMRLPLPPNDQGRDSLDIDYADTAAQVLQQPEDQHPEFAEQIVFGMMRQLRSRGIAFGTHYPPLSTDLARQVMLAALRSGGLNAHFDFPDSLLLTLPDGGTLRKDVGGLLPLLEGLDEEHALEKAVEFAAALANQVSEVQTPVSPERLRTRLYAESSFPEGVLAKMVARPMATGVAEVVVLDLPDTIRPLTPGDLEGLGLGVEQAFDRAVEGSLSEPVEVSRMDAGGTSIVHIGSENGFYAASHLHVLARHLGEARYGALVVFPSPPVLMAHVLGASANPIGAMSTLQELAARFAADAGKPISDKLYWWRPESAAGGRPRLAEVRIELDEQTQRAGVYSEDEDFLPLLRSLN
ncbi:hypothetical protein ACWGSK_18325 [Nocardiopsis sp. NPDC055551]|uniref:hypothetical protein n=1 Tax=Nocardiopsis sp. NPDC006832 TaxID=3157188 RepID=UPI0033BFED3C